MMEDSVIIEEYPGPTGLDRRFKIRFKDYTTTFTVDELKFLFAAAKKDGYVRVHVTEMSFDGSRVRMTLRVNDATGLDGIFNIDREIDLNIGP